MVAWANLEGDIDSRGCCFTMSSDDTVQFIMYKAHSLCLALTPEDEYEGDWHGD